jgi:hypothetical protein
MRGVRAPHRRTAHTAHPPVRGCGVGCAVGGANLAPPAHPAPLGPPRGWSAACGEPRQAPEDRTSPLALLGCHVIQRERPQPFPGLETRTSRPPGRSGLLTGQQQPESEAIGRVVGRPGRQWWSPIRRRWAWWALLASAWSTAESAPGGRTLGRVTARSPPSTVVNGPADSKDAVGAGRRRNRYILSAGTDASCPPRWLWRR